MDENTLAVQRIRQACLEQAVKFADTVISAGSSDSAVDADAIVADAEIFRAFVQAGVVPMGE